MTIRTISFDEATDKMILRHQAEFNKKQGTNLNFSQTVAKLCKKGVELDK